MFLVDSHCHLDLLDLKPYAGDLNQAIQQAYAEGVKHILNVSVSIKTFPLLLATAKKYPFVSASVGLHPNETEEETSAEELCALAADEKVVAIGETGLDYYRSTGEVEWQRKRFREHILTAQKTERPLIVHSRQAKEDTLKLLREEQSKGVRGVLHCFTEDWEMASQALDLGFYISFSGIVTFRNA
ncbi:MAG TPA: TatD family hydrolase, partial [Gammaproteobacteria bacterium]|nr:TatD family hydrolase [Gammaproteobacteria bacterium]